VEESRPSSRAPADRQDAPHLRLVPLLRCPVQRRVPLPVHVGIHCSARVHGHWLGYSPPWASPLHPCTAGAKFRGRATTCSQAVGALQVTRAIDAYDVYEDEDAG